MINIENVVHKYKVWEGDESRLLTALDHISFEVGDGGFVALLGANGCGKSTMARHTNALLLPDEGKVTVDGMDTSDPENTNMIRRKVGMVFQDPDNQIIGTSVEEDVAFGPENRALPPEDIRRYVADSLKAVGLFSERKSSPVHLSGGQKQRVAVAGVLATDNSCIVLDEPTAMLDPRSRREFMETLEKLRSMGKTIVLITHHTDEVTGADVIVGMKDGRVIAKSSPSEFFGNRKLIQELRMDVPASVEIGRSLADMCLIPEGVYLSPEILCQTVMCAWEKEGSLRPEMSGDAPQTAFSEKNRDCSGCCDIRNDSRNETRSEFQNDAPPLMQLQEVSFSYEQGTAREKSVLKNITLDIRKGEFAALVGSSGSGKTTMVKLLNGLLKASSGRIFFEGEDIYGKNYQLRGLRKKVGMIFQNPEQQLFCKTVLSDVEFGPLHVGMSREESDEAARHALELVGITEDKFQMNPLDLSGGQKKRVAIAGVLAMRPSVLIMDEPAAGLDPGSRDQIFQLIQRIRREEGTTVVLISHDMDEVARWADRVMVLHDGTIEADGRPEDVFQEEKLLEDTGVDLPQSGKIMRLLREKGFPAGRLEMTNEAAIRAIAAVLKAGDENA
ncbi:MAG: energy-coupling factor transporter ATPase [Mobilibacterium timonense]|uniref:energy-coupling factor transporter ATPase n=1 Tax=Mobilibacterium timonense TaxID=1871012 RepID=UPI000985CD7F|nr:energy-coupling factor transporter ATPase [Mobilibacterium timonense]MBM6990008.1 energy-coupling factor transporter ATPase [Mobilibacterium timonense]